MSLDKIFNDFAKLLEIRLNRNITTTEDSIRYTLFTSMIQNNIQPDEVVLEYPHPQLPKKRIDTWLSSYEGKPVAMEFKYDRDRPGQRNKPRTMQAGQAFKDIYRLSRLKEGTENFFVYVTTREMHTYYNNATNGHSEFYNLPLNNQMNITERYFSEKPDTFRNALGCSHFSAGVKMIFYSSLPNNHELRIYKVNSSLL